MCPWGNVLLCCGAVAMFCGRFGGIWYCLLGVAMPCGVVPHLVLALVLFGDCGNVFQPLFQCLAMLWQPCGIW